MERSFQVGNIGSIAGGQTPYQVRAEEEHDGRFARNGRHLQQSIFGLDRFEPI
jgi:hypothetical protein